MIQSITLTLSPPAPPGYKVYHYTTKKLTLSVMYDGPDDSYLHFYIFAPKTQICIWIQDIAVSM